jgi:hypothetical protein
MLHQKTAAFTTLASLIHDLRLSENVGGRYKHAGFYVLVGGQAYEVLNATSLAGMQLPEV